MHDERYEKNDFPSDIRIISPNGLYFTYHVSCFQTEEKKSVQEVDQPFSLCRSAKLFLFFSALATTATNNAAPL
jgi:hypothetical protein